MRKKHTVFLLLLVTGLLFVCIFLTPKSKTLVPTTSSKEVSPFSAKELAVVSPFKLPESIEQPFKVTRVTWDDTIKPSIRFILLPSYQQLNDKQVNQIQGWLDEKRTVLFIEDNVDPKLLAAKLQFEFKLTELQSSQPFSYRLYGFGYSFIFGKYMPVFYGSNDSFSDQSIKDALSFLSTLIDKPEY